ncbi:MAG: hypothetical protein ACE5QF_05360 [Thermoplasmata archaeon]
MVDIVESEEFKEELLNLKRKTFKKMEELATRERELERRKKAMARARRNLERLRIELSKKEERLKEKEEHLALWEKELRNMGKKLAEGGAATEVPTPALRPTEKRRRLFRLGKKGKKASKS